MTSARLDAPLLRLFGVPRLTEPATIEVVASGKVSGPTLALLYLASRPDPNQPVTYEELEGALETESEARVVVSRSLKVPWYTKLLELAGGLAVQKPGKGSHLHWPIDTDVRRFQAAVRGRDWRSAILWYTGPFLQGIETEAGWVVGQRTELREKCLEALEEWLQEVRYHRQFQDGIEVTGSLLASDPFDDRVVRALMELHALNGERDQALRAYDSFRSALAAEALGDAEDETRELARQIRIGSFRSLLPSARFEVQPPDRIYGREGDLNELLLDLQDVSRRLLTIKSLGGMGKTTLARAFAARHGARYASGACLVELARLETVDEIAQALAVPLRLSFVEGRERLDQVLDALREQQLLLVFDNCETCPAAGTMIERVLNAAPKVVVLATSREALSRRQASLKHLESVYLLGRPPLDAHDGGAARLFERAAQRERADFHLGDEERPLLERVYESVGGLPLALELTGGLVARQGWPGLFDHLERGAGLAGSGEDAVLQRVYSASCGSLEPELRTMYQGLTVFAGPFTSDAATSILDHRLSREGLNVLNAKSLLEADASGRYRIHPVLRSFAERDFAKTALHDIAHARHATHYATWLERAWNLGSGEAEVIEEITDVRQAWRWMLEHQRFDPPALALQSRIAFELEEFAPARALVEAALPHLSGSSLDRGHAISVLGLLEYGRNLHTARDHFGEALEIALKHQDTTLEAHVSHWLALCLMDEDVGRATQLLERAYELYSGAEHTLERVRVLRGLARVQLERHEDLNAAQVLLEKALADLETLDAPVDRAKVLTNLGIVLRYRAGHAKDAGRREEADDLFVQAWARLEESQAVYVELGRAQHEYSWALNLGNLADIAAARGEHDEAIELLGAVIEAFRRVGNLEKLSGAYCNRGMSLLARNETESAIIDLNQALEFAHKSDSAQRLVEIENLMKNFK